MEKDHQSQTLNNVTDFHHITEEENTIIESNKILKENIIDYLFILKNYGKCHSFLSEIIQTEGITIYEHQKLKEIIRYKSIFEGKTCHGFTVLFGLFYLRHIFRRGNSLYKFFMGCLYPLFFFHCSFNFGRHLGLFLIEPKIYTTLLNLKNGDSIHAYQTRLFVKRCLYEEYMIREKRAPAESWSNSFLLDQVFGSRIAKFNLFIKKIQGKVNLFKERYIK